MPERLTLEERRLQLPRLNTGSNNSSQQHKVKRKPVPLQTPMEERGRPSQGQTSSSSRWNTAQRPEKRLSTQSEIDFAWYGAPLPNLHRSDARAGNGKKKEPDQAEAPVRKVRPKASTFSFTKSENVNRTEADLEGYDSKSFANRMRSRTNATDQEAYHRFGSSRSSNHGHQRQSPKTRDPYDRPLSTINEDMSLLEGVPTTMMPSYAALRPEPSHEIFDPRITPPPGEKRHAVDRSQYRDSAVRLSAVEVDLGSMGGFLSNSDRNLPPPPPLRRTEPARESRFYESFPGSPLEQVEKMSRKEEQRSVRFKEELEWTDPRGFN